MGGRGFRPPQQSIRVRPNKDTLRAQRLEGEESFNTLWAKQRLAMSLSAQCNYDEAESR